MPDTKSSAGNAVEPTVLNIHKAITEANLEYVGYSCNGINLFGDRKSIDAAMTAFHSHSQIDKLKTQIQHWREECGKLHALINGEPQALPVKLTGELACILEDCLPPDKQTPEAVAALIEGYQPIWDRIRSALTRPQRGSE